MARLLVNTIHQTYMAYDEIGLLAQSSEIVLDSVVTLLLLLLKKIGRGGGVYLIKRNIIFTLISYKFCIFKSESEA